MFSKLSKLSKPLLAFGAFAFLAVGFFSLAHYGMGMSADMDMSGCPFMSEVAICDMTALDHLAGWQSAFSNIITPGVIVLVLVLLAATALPYWTLFIPPPKFSQSRLRVISRALRTPVPTVLQYLFSQGILHPKLF